MYTVYSYTHPPLPPSGFSGTPQFVSIPVLWLGGGGSYRHHHPLPLLLDPNSTDICTWIEAHATVEATPPPQSDSAAI